MSILKESISIFADVLGYLIFIRVILSWFDAVRNTVLFNLIFNLTEPILGPIRSLLMKSPLGGPGMMLDFSPIIAYLFIEVCKSVIIGLL